MRRKKIIMMLLAVASIAACLLLPGLIFSAQDSFAFNTVHTVTTASYLDQPASATTDMDNYRVMLLVSGILKNKRENMAFFTEEELQGFYASNNTSMIELAETIDKSLYENVMPLVEKLLTLDAYGIYPGDMLAKHSTSVITYTDIYMSKYSCRTALMKFRYGMPYYTAEDKDKLDESSGQITDVFSMELLMEVDSGYFLGLKCSWNDDMVDLYSAYVDLFSAEEFPSMLSEILSHMSYIVVSDVSANPPQTISPLPENPTSYYVENSFVYMVRDLALRRNFYLTLQVNNNTLEIYFNPIVED